MLAKTGGLDYSQYKIGELRGFVRDREATHESGSATGPKPNKSALIKRLRALDGERTFHRFLDLPPEVRLHIYGYTLAAKINGRPQSQILTASKLVHIETREVLLDLCDFALQIWSDGSAIKVGPRSFRYTQGELCFEDTVIYGDTTRNEKARHALRAMRQARELKVLLEVPREASKALSSKFRVTLRAACILLANAPRLLRLIVDITDHDSVFSQALLETVLSPTSMLPERTKLTVNNVTSGQASRITYHRQVQPPIPINDLLTMHSMAKQAREYSSRMLQVPGNLGMAHRRHIMGAIKQLYFGRDGEEDHKVADFRDLKAVDQAVKGAKRFKDAFDEAMKLQEPGVTQQHEQMRKKLHST